MTIRLAGLGGFDSSGVIDKLVAIARQPIVDLDRQKSLLDAAVATLNGFSTKLGALKSAARALMTPTGFSSATASSSDGAVAASVTGSTPVGSYSVEVTRLARSQKVRGEASASSTTALGFTGTLEVQVGASAAKTVDVTAADGLVDIAAKIGASGARVSASVIYDGSAYRLALQGLDSGAANAFTVTETGVSLGLADPANVHETAEDALFAIDGLSMTRPTNQIADAVPGVTFALAKTTTSAVTVRITNDATGLESKVKSFVDAYNDVVSAGHTAAGFGSAKAQNRFLAGDAVVRRSLDRIARLVAALVPGSLSSMPSLSSAGIKLAENGALSFDVEKLKSALESDPAGVRRLFVEDATVGSTGVMTGIASAVDALLAGTGAPVKTRIEGLTAQAKRIADARAPKEKRVEQYETQLRRQFAALDQAMTRYQSLAVATSSIGGFGSSGFGGSQG